MLSKMKKVFSFVCLAILLASCDLNIDTPDKPSNVDPSAVGFNVYVNRGLQTKAGWGGVLTLDDLKDETKANGFGVFAYYGNGALYNETMMPDFMYDQQVKWTGNNVWEYSPIKYWPNEFGEAASSEAADRLTFFAYAPFADVTPSTGVVTDGSTTGIIGMSRNISKGDPVVMYSSSLTPGNGVDLCWGVAAEPFTSSVDGDNNHVAAGYPFLNVIKPKTGDHLKFEFNHALAQLNVQIDADINNEVAGDSYTKIYVRSVTFNGFSMRGSLNLNSNKTEGPIWYDISGTGKLKREPVTVYDGRTDGMEGVATATDVSEKPVDLNPIIVQDKPYGDAQLSAGVTTTAVNLFNNADAEAPVMVIPTPGVPMSVTIVYDVETEDGRLAGLLSDGVTHGSSVENKITKTITTNEGNMILSSGKKYVVKLHLGLTSVKFDADVAIWDNTSYYDVYLPDNKSLGSVSLTDGTDVPYADITVWRNENITTIPTVKVLDSEGSDITDETTISWSSDNADVATVASNGAVSLEGMTGTAVITATAVRGDQKATNSYKVYVNAVTSVEISPSPAKVAPERTLQLTATLTHTNNGAIASWPTLSWESENTEIITVSPTSTVVSNDGTATKASTTISGIAVGNTNIIVSVPSLYTASSVSATLSVSCETPAGTSGGLFSVSATKKVYIATSNLMWEGTTEGGTYSLMQYPWSMIEEAGSTILANYGISATNSVKVSYFGWGSSSIPYLTSNNNSDYAVGGFVDWGSMYGDGKWYTLTINEWNYLKNRGGGWGLATVNNVHGVVLIPDVITIPSGVSYTAGSSNGFNTNSYTIEQWEKMQTAGAVFIPAAGHRDVYDGNIIKNVGDEVYLWSTNVYDATRAYDFVVISSGWVAQANRFYMGGSIRLVY